MASFEGHDEIVVYLMSQEDQEILMNSYNQNLLDIALNEEKRNVAMAIAEHPRWIWCKHASLQSRHILQCDRFGRSNWPTVGASEKMIITGKSQTAA